MASALLWWLASTYYPLERAPRNVNNRAPMKRDNLTLVRKRTLAARSKKPTVSGRSSIKTSPVGNPGKICRVCLKDGEIPIYGTGTDLCEAVKVFGDVQIKKDDKFPKYLCDVCHSMLQSAILFRKQAKETELLLQKKIKDEFSKFASKKSQSAAAAVAECEEKIVSIKHKPQPIFHKSESEFEVKNQYIESPQPSPDRQEVHLPETDSAVSCGVCKLNFTSTSDYTSHQSSEQHKKSLMLYFTDCKVCKKTIPSSSFQQHLKLHSSKSKICEICGKTYSTSFGLYSHVQLHSSELPFHCTLCPYRGKTASSYKIHMRTHTGDKPYTCEECGLGYTTKSNLVKHRLRHKEKQFKCKECEKSYYDKRDLEDHVKCVHLCIEEFECEICGNKFRCKKRLRKHERKVHKKNKITRGRKPLYLQNES